MREQGSRVVPKFSLRKDTGRTGLSFAEIREEGRFDLGYVQSEMPVGGLGFHAARGESVGGLHLQFSLGF